MSSSDDDDAIQLSAEAMKALKEFYEEQNEKLLTQCDSEKDAKDVKFDEDWVGYFNISTQYLNVYKMIGIINIFLHYVFCKSCVLLDYSN